MHFSLYNSLATFTEMTFVNVHHAQMSIVVIEVELHHGDCFADSTPLGFNTTRIPHFKTPKKNSKLGAVGIRP